MQPHNKIVHKSHQGDVWSSLNRTLMLIYKLHEQYQRIFLMECIRGVRFNNELIEHLHADLEILQKESKVFLDWYLHAEDAVKIVRKNRELEETERFEAMIQADERIP